MLKQQRRSDLRRSILEHASELLVSEGITALSMRRLSQRAGFSTTVLYSCFRDKQEILDHLFLEGFTLLRQRLEAVPVEEAPLDYIIALGHAYRGNALDNPTWYQLILGRAIPGFEPSREYRERSQESFAVLIAAIQRCIDLNLVRESDPYAIAQILWGTIHGQISLQLLGYFRDEEQAEARFEQAMSVTRQGLARLDDDKGGDPC